MIKSSSWAIEMKMFILLIFQNMKAIIDAFLACMMRAGSLQKTPSFSDGQFRL